jgi:CRP/FNR family transcriptional regulator
MKRAFVPEGPERSYSVSSLWEMGQRWERTGEPGAGWELVRALKSADRKTRETASVLLAKTNHLRLPGSVDLALREKFMGRRTGNGNALPVLKSGEAEMNTPYGLEIIESCMNCKLRKEYSFCNMSYGLLKNLSASSHQCTYPGAAVLFVEGQMPRGAFMLCSGQVKLSTTSREGKVLILKIAEAGDVLGLSAVISNTAYEMTAESSSPCQVNFMERESLIELIGKNGEAGLRSAEALSREFQSAYRDIHDLVLARSSANKLARLLLSWTDRHDQAEREIRIHSSLTHEEMAQMIGASRETVTRLISDLKRKDLIRLDGSTLVIRNKNALEALAA